MLSTDRLYALSKEKNIPVPVLCQEAGVSVSTVYMAAERRSELTLPVIRKFCIVLEISLSEFFNY